jgi:hypothetical protein
MSYFPLTTKLNTCGRGTKPVKFEEYRSIAAQRKHEKLKESERLFVKKIQKLEIFIKTQHETI